MRGNICYGCRINCNESNLSSLKSAHQSNTQEELHLVLVSHLCPIHHLRLSSHSITYSTQRTLIKLERLDWNLRDFACILDHGKPLVFTFYLNPAGVKRCLAVHVEEKHSFVLNVSSIYFFLYFVFVSRYSKMKFQVMF